MNDKELKRLSRIKKKHLIQIINLLMPTVENLLAARNYKSAYRKDAAELANSLAILEFATLDIAPITTIYQEWLRDVMDREDNANDWNSNATEVHFSD